MEVNVKAGMSRFEWNMRGPAPPSPAGRGGGGNNQEQEGGRGPAVRGVPFVAAGGGGSGGGFGRGARLGPLLEPGTYMVRLTIGGQTPASSVDVLDDIWMRPQ